MPNLKVLNPQGELLGMYCRLGRVSTLRSPVHRRAQSAMDQWIDTDGIDRYYRSILSIDTFGLIFIDVIDPSVKDFFIFAR
jgi:hypothetical protein